MEWVWDEEISEGVHLLYKRTRVRSITYNVHNDRERFAIGNINLNDGYAHKWELMLMKIPYYFLSFDMVRFNNGQHETVMRMEMELNKEEKPHEEPGYLYFDFTLKKYSEYTEDKLTQVDETKIIRINTSTRPIITCSYCRNYIVFYVNRRKIGEIKESQEIDNTPKYFVSYVLDETLDIKLLYSRRSVI